MNTAPTSSNFATSSGPRHLDDRTWNLLVEDLYRAQFEPLCNLARRLLDTRHAAEEVVQEGFARLTALTRRPHPGCEPAYLRSIVMNEARSTLRRRQVHERRICQPAHPDDTDHTADAAVKMAAASDLHDMVATLPLRQRQVITLRHLVGMSESETASCLAISPGSVKTHAHRGLSALKGRIDVAA